MPRRVLLPLGLLLLYLGTALFAPAALRAQAALDCRLDRRTPPRPRALGFEPSMFGAFSDPELLTALRTAYASVPRPTLERSLEATHRLALERANPCAQALAAYALGRITQSSDVAASRQWLDRAERAFAQAGSPTGLAHVHFEQAADARNSSAPAQVIERFTAVAAEFDRAGDPGAALNARLHAVDHRSSHPETVYQPLLDQARRFDDLLLEARIRHTWGDDLFTHGLYDQATRQYHLADQLYVDCRCQLAQRATLQTSLGRIERTQGRAREAIPHYRLALSLQRQDGDRSLIPQTLNAISVAYQSMSQYPLAIAYVRQALAVARSIHSQEFIDFLEANLGTLYAQSGQSRRGLPLLERSTARLVNDYQRCTRYRQLAALDQRLGRLAEALEAITRSITACDRHQDPRGTADSLEIRARIRAAAISPGSSSSAALDDALADAQRSLSLIEQISAHVVPEDAHRRGYNQATLDIHETTIALLTRLGRYPEALEVTEQSRARAFLDLLSSPRTAVPVAAIPAPELAPAANARLLATTRNNLRGAQPGQDGSTNLVLESESHTTPIRREEIFEQARRLHTTLIAYWVTADRLYTWVVSSTDSSSGEAGPKETPSQETLHGLSQPVGRATLEALIQSAAPLSGTAATQRAARARLHRILIAPIEGYLPPEGSLLTVVPHGPLFQLSFAALSDPGRRYLVERFALNTIPSVGVLRYTQRNLATAAAQPPHYTLLANPTPLPSPGGTPLPPLPGTADEIAAIARTLPPGQATLLQGSRANTAELNRELQSATVVHLATHAIVSGTDPFGSFLALSRSGDNGLLTTVSIYGLRLRTRMVVLSACRTGRGPVSSDGVAGLSRAFFYAGSASVLSSLWDVADQPTATLMPLFYQRLAAGDGHAQALRSAQVQMIARLRRGDLRLADGRRLPEDPAYWAAFTLAGEP